MKATRIITISIIMLLTCFASFAQTDFGKYALLNRKVNQFEKAEWTINLSEAFINPYDQKDIGLNLLLTSPSGRFLSLPCYFESGDKKASVWKARFAPQEAGGYVYHFELNCKSGRHESTAASFIANPGTKHGFLHKNNMWTFKYDDGKLFRGVGENVGWESRTFEKDKYTYDYLLPKLAKNGGNFFRTWMCYWNIPLEWHKVQSTNRYQNSDDYFNPGAIKRMDELVNMTDSLGLHFMLTLDWHGHLMEEGGWKNSNYNKINGGPAANPTEYFTLQASRKKYKNKLRYIVARWGYSTSIAAWEFFNEIDNAAYNSADSVIIPQKDVAEWHAEMSRYLKDIDPYGHLVTTSVSHRDIMGMNSIPYIDFNQKHIYKNTGKIPVIYADYINGFGKPYVIGEFGYRWEDDDQKYGKEVDFDFKRGLWYGLFSPTPILPMSWWWEMFDERNLTPYFKGVRMISEAMLTAGNGHFEQFAVSSGLIQSYGVKCGEKYFVYLLNNAAAPETVKVKFEALTKSMFVRTFNPETQVYGSAGNPRLMNISLQPQQEIVLIFSAK